MRVIQHLRATNDVNGNPRRLYVVLELKDQPFNTAKVVAVYDEGYQGKGAMPRECEKMSWLPNIDISISEYKRFKRMGTELSD